MSQDPVATQSLFLSSKKLKKVKIYESLHYNNLLDFLVIQKKYINTIAPMIAYIFLSIQNKLSPAFKYIISNLLQQLDILMQACDFIQKDQIQHLSKIFNKFDVNRHGHITFDQLAKAMKILGMPPTKEQINTLINQYDLDGDGHIDFNQYKQIYLSRRPLPTEEEILGAFKQFDQKNTGLIDADCIKSISLKMGMLFSDSQIKKMIDQIDEDKDGHITWTQFRRAVLQ